MNNQKMKFEGNIKIIKCPKCGADNIVGALKCGKCGYPFIKPNNKFDKHKED